MTFSSSSSSAAAAALAVVSEGTAFTKFVVKSHLCQLLAYLACISSKKVESLLFAFGRQYVLCDTVTPIVIPFSGH
jgi:hypothetical protein